MPTPSKKAKFLEFGLENANLATLVQVSILLQPLAVELTTVVASFVPGNFGLFWWNPEVPQNPG